MSINLSITPIGSRVSKWGEGPIFWEDHLLYVDIEGHALIRLHVETGEEKVWEMGERIGTVGTSAVWWFSVCRGFWDLFSLIQKTSKKKKLADPEGINAQITGLMMENVTQAEGSGPER